MSNLESPDIAALMRDMQSLDAEQPAARGRRVGTSEKYRDSVKIFLDKLDVRTDAVKAPTFKIIYRVLEDLTLPKINEQMRIRTQQQINLISLVLKMIDVHKTINELTIATYTLNKEAFAIITDLLRSGRIKKLSLFLASSYTFREPKYYEYLKGTALTLQKKYDIAMVFAWSHLKITLARCGRNRYQFEGSMNYSTNNMAEQIVFENRRATYDHDYAFFQDIMAQRNDKALEIVGKEG